MDSRPCIANQEIKSFIPGLVQKFLPSPKTFSSFSARIILLTVLLLLFSGTLIDKKYKTG